MAEHNLPWPANAEQRSFLATLRFKKDMSVLGALHGSRAWGDWPDSERLSHLAMMARAHDRERLGQRFFVAVVKAEVSLQRLTAEQRAVLEKPFERLEALMTPEDVERFVRREADIDWLRPPCREDAAAVYAAGFQPSLTARDKDRGREP